jgi:hypothetical protein
MGAICLVGEGDLPSLAHTKNSVALAALSRSKMIK